MSDPQPGPSTLNIPAGRSPITPDAPPRSPSDRLSGNRVQDVKAAVARIDVKRDFENLGRIPCVRKSLLYGIGGGVGMGAIRFLGTSKPKIAANWAVASFTVIALVQWEACRRGRLKELEQMQMIRERYPHRHISKLKKAGDEQAKEEG